MTITGSVLCGILVLSAAAALAAATAVRTDPPASPFVVVLGIAQDAGYPQAGCTKPCCAPAWTDASRRRHVVCLGIVDPVSGQRWMIEATPDFREQLRALNAVAPPPPGPGPGLAGLFLTHAHIGHYTGLIHLGHEVIGAKQTPTYVMPRFRTFLETQGPWDQLVRFENIAPVTMTADDTITLSPRLSITPFLVPHRDEYSETVGFIVRGPQRAVAFIPDIDKWDRWDRRIEEVLADIDVAFLDGTFYAEGEIPHRNMSEIPHPFIAETMSRLAPLPASERAKVRFTHLNHTNPTLDPDGDARKAVEAAGYGIARQGARIDL